MRTNHASVRLTRRVEDRVASKGGRAEVAPLLDGTLSSENEALAPVASHLKRVRRVRQAQ